MTTTITREIARRLLARLDYMRIVPRVIADLSGDIRHTRKELKKRYRRADIITALPSNDHSVDLIFANLALYLANDITVSIQQFARALTANGLVLFSTLGPDTFKELTVQHAAFIDMHDIGDALLRSHLTDPVMDMEFIQLHYANRKAWLKDISALRLAGFTLNNVPCSTTLELIYGHAWGCPVTRAASLNAHGEAVIPVATLRRKSDTQGEYGNDEETQE